MKGKKTKVLVSMDKKIAKKLKALSKLKETPMNKIIEEALLIHAFGSQAH